MGDALTTTILGLVGGVIDRIIPDPAAKAAAQFALLKLAQDGSLAELTATTDLAKGQLATNTAEAANGNIFVSGWRPAVGWACAIAFGTSYVVAPLATWGGNLFGHPIAFPPLDLTTMMPVLIGMLGLGAMRSVEKVQASAGAAHG